MNLGDNDIEILKWLNTYDGNVEIKKENAPYEVRTKVEFRGANTYAHPNSIFVRLKNLSVLNLVNGSMTSYRITDDGRRALQEILHTASKQEFVSNLKFQELSNNVQILEGKLRDQKPKKMRDLVIILISLGALIVSLISLFKK